MKQVKIFKNIASIGLVMALISGTGCSKPDIKESQPAKKESVSTKPTPETPQTPQTPQYTPAEPGQYHKEIDKLLKEAPKLGGANPKVVNSVMITDFISQKESITNPDNLTENENYALVIQQSIILANLDLFKDGKLSDYWYELQPTEEDRDYIKQIVDEMNESAKSGNWEQSRTKLEEVMASNSNLNDKKSNVAFTLLFVTSTTNKKTMDEANSFLKKAIEKLQSNEQSSNNTKIRTLA